MTKFVIEFINCVGVGFIFCLVGGAFIAAIAWIVERTWLARAIKFTWDLICVIAICAFIGWVLRSMRHG